MAMAAATLSSVMWKIDRLLNVLGSSEISSLESFPVEEALNNLKSTLPKLHSAASVVEDDDDEELPETHVHDTAGEWWLQKVKAVAYDAEDVLDDCEHELRLDAAARRPAAVGDSVASAAAGASPVLLQISDIWRRFEGIMTEHDQTLNQRLEDIAVMPPPTTPFPAAAPPPDPILSTVYGREDDKEKIVQLLLSPPPPPPPQQQQHGDRHRPLIIAVVGEEGVGKTTLCRLVYTDPRICEHFDVRIWASVSQQCLTVDAIAGDSYHREVGFLAHLPQWELTRSHFLLVVDDLEPEDLGFWETVYNTFGVASRGSQVLLTSRTEEHLAKITAVAGMPICHRLGHLTEECSWSLFRDLAFFHGLDHEVPPSMEAIGRRNCRKCGGSPLLLKMIDAALLHSDEQLEDEEQYWDKGRQPSNRSNRRTRKMIGAAILLGPCASPISSPARSSPWRTRAISPLVRLPRCRCRRRRHTHLARGICWAFPPQHGHHRRHPHLHVLHHLPPPALRQALSAHHGDGESLLRRCQDQLLRRGRHRLRPAQLRSGETDGEIPAPVPFRVAADPQGGAGVRRLPRPVRRRGAAPAAPQVPAHFPCRVRRHLVRVLPV